MLCTMWKIGVVKKQRSKSQDFLLLGNLDSFLCQIAKITILAEFLVQQTQRQKNCVFAVLKMWKIFLIYAAFFIAGFFKWNLWRLKPQQIIAISKFKAFDPLLRALVYDLFHLIMPFAPSDWILRFIRSSAPWMLFRLQRTSLWNFVSSSFKRILRFPLHLQHFSFCRQLLQSSHW